MLTSVERVAPRAGGTIDLVERSDDLSIRATVSDARAPRVARALIAAVMEHDGSPSALPDLTVTATDLSYVEATIGAPARIRRAANMVRSVQEPRRVGRLKLRWRGGSAEDSPDVVAQLGPGIARAARAGLGVDWSSYRTGNEKHARLWLHVPSRLEARGGETLLDHPGKLRRLVRAIRLVRWPGLASFSVSFGNGTCNELPTVAALVRVVSTSDGPARAVEQDNSCSSDEAVVAMRRAWNAGAERRR